MIKDQFTALKGTVSRQRIWQLRKKARGLCINCGRPAVNKNHCAVCNKKDKLLDMKQYRKNLQANRAKSREYARKRSLKTAPKRAAYMAHRKRLIAALKESYGL